ncbi:MAG: hypothetical protein KME25_22690 [Symplocastrum torsivum CPER-KK1]|uniref:Uncharacterized protein n=1 Tax=Symplocastrum torsivum CPER-KK1 TaxID=450513 RepID=A0A951PPE1_9CYAN|nr:hypothetical protein [Symplocastrum torsivum CPER-KK1]
MNFWEGVGGDSKLSFALRVAFPWGNGECRVLQHTRDCERQDYGKKRSRYSKITRVLPLCK